MVNAGRRRIVVGCVFVQYGNVDKRIDVGIAKFGVAKFGVAKFGVDRVGGGERHVRHVRHVRDACDVGGEWGCGRRAVDDVLPRRGADWSGTRRSVVACCAPALDITDARR